MSFLNLKRIQLTKIFLKIFPGQSDLEEKNLLKDLTFVSSSGVKMSRCKVYGCDMKKCHCGGNECCTRIDCSHCSKIANKCKRISKGFSEETIDFALKAQNTTSKTNIKE